MRQKINRQKGGTSMNISPLTTVDSQAVSSALDEFGNQVQDVLN